MADGNIEERRRIVGRRRDDSEQEALAVIAAKVLDGIEVGRNILLQGGKLDLMNVVVNNIAKWSEKHEVVDDKRFDLAHDEAVAQNLVALGNFQRLDEKVDMIMQRVMWAAVSAVLGLFVVVVNFLLTKILAFPIGN